MLGVGVQVAASHSILCSAYLTHYTILVGRAHKITTTTKNKSEIHTNQPLYQILVQEL